MLNPDPFAVDPAANAPWLKYLPRPVRERLTGRASLQGMVGNSGWLLLDKVLRMGVGLVVGAWIARYLGPGQFGLWNYATAFTFLFSAIAGLGLDSIVVRELASHPEDRDALLGSVFVLKLCAGVSTFALTVGAIVFVKGDDSLTVRLVALSAAAFIFQAWNVVDFYFQSKVRSRYTVYATNATFLLMALVRVGLLLAHAPLIAFAWAALAEAAIAALALVGAYHYNALRIGSWRFSRRHAGMLLRDSWPLLFSGMAVSVFMKIDQVMLESLADAHAVGIYAAAVRVSEVWYFGSAVVLSSVAPAIYRARLVDREEYLRKLQGVFNIMCVLSLMIIVALSVSASLVIGGLFGAAYTEASTVLLVHTWSTLFVFMGSAQALYWTAENMQRFSLALTTVAALTNIALNFLLIPRYGPVGAAVATLVSYGVPTIMVPALHPRTRPVFHMFLRSFRPSSYAR